MTEYKYVVKAMAQRKIRLFYEKMALFLRVTREMLTFASDKVNKREVMAKTEYIIIKNASRKILQRMRQIGIDKSQRLQEVQKRWDTGEYKNSEVVQL